MATVAELLVEMDAKDKGVLSLLNRVNGELEAIDGKDVEVGITADGDAAEKKIREVDDALAELQANNSLNITVQTRAETAISDLERVNEYLDIVDGKEIDVTVKADVAEARSGLAIVEAELNRLDAEKTELNIDMDISGPMAKILALRTALGPLRRDLIDLDKVSLDNLRNSTDNLSRAAQKTSVQISGMTSVIFGLGPALVPLAAVGVVGIGALGAGFTAAGVAAGLFGAVTISALQPVADALEKAKTLQDAYNMAVTDKQKETALAKLNQLYASLEPGQLALVKGVQEFQAQWSKLTEQIRPQIYLMAADALKAMSNALPGLVPFLEDVVAAVRRLQDASLAAFKSPVWSQFFDNIKSSGAPALESLGRSIGNIVTGFVGIFNAFFPQVAGFNAGLESMTQKFEDWGVGLASSPGFKAFITYVQQQVPKVFATMGDLADAFVAIAKAAAPIGDKVLSAISGISNAIVTLGTTNPNLLTFILGMTAIGVVIGNIAGPILSTIQLFTKLAPVLADLRVVISTVTAGIDFGLIASFLGIVGAVAAFVGALVLAYQHLDGFRAAVDGLGATIMSMFSPVFDAIGQAAAAVGAFFTEMVNKVKAWAAEHTASFSGAWEGVKSIMDTALTGIVTSINGFLVAIRDGFTLLWDGIKNIVQGAWEIIKAIISGAIDIILGVIGAFISGLTGDWDGLWKSIQQVADGAWTIITGVIRGALQIILGVIESFIGLISGAFRVMWEAVSQVFKSGWITIKAIIPDGLKAMMTSIESWYGAFKNAGAKLLSQLADGIKSGIADAVGSVKSAVDQMTAYLPGSPAEIGPLSGHGYVKLRGQRFMEDLAIGLTNTDDVQRQVSGLSAMLALEPDASGMSSATLARAYGANSAGASSIVYVTVADGAVSVDARGAADASGVYSAVQTASATLADQLRMALEKR